VLEGTRGWPAPKDNQRMKKFQGKKRPKQRTSRCKPVGTSLAKRGNRMEKVSVRLGNKGTTEGERPSWKRGGWGVNSGPRRARRKKSGKRYKKSRSSQADEEERLTRGDVGGKGSKTSVEIQAKRCANLPCQGKTEKKVFKKNQGKKKN